MKHLHHKIIFKNGQRIRTKETIEYTIEEHAAEHKRLYKVGGHWQDKLAYQGLSGQIESKDVIMEVYKANGKAQVHHMHTKEIKEKSLKARMKVVKGRTLTPEHLAATRTWGMKQTDYQKKRAAEALSKTYLITHNNKTRTIKNLRKFAIEHNLDQGNLTKVAQGKLKQHKGYVVNYK
jgi:hypothetical protein